jgi:hypothetical protein
MNKKILISILLMIWFFLTSCEKEIDNDKTVKYSIELFNCTDDWLKDDCNKNKKWVDNIWNILKINEDICDLGVNIVGKNYENIFYNYIKWVDVVSDVNINKDNDWIKSLEFRFKKWEIDEKNNKWKKINIMYDLTYFWKPWSSTEKDVLENRKSFLSNIVSDGIWNVKLKYWDEIKLSYVWTNDYWAPSEWHSNTAITDSNVFVLKKDTDDLSWKYNIKYICEKNKRKKTLKIYYKFQKQKSNFDKKFNKEYISSLEKLNDVMLKTVNDKYKSWEYNRWSYLIDSLDKNLDFINWAWSINILISDMFFQIHPEMKKSKNIIWADFDFGASNILKLWKRIDYTRFYHNIIPKYLVDKCNSDEKLYIIWIELWNNLDVKKKMRDYYKSILFKWCSVYFNL